MPRPLMQSRIGDLEELFASSRGNRDVLKQLEHELQFRQVPRALTLLEQVQQAKASAVATTGVAAAPRTTTTAVNAPTANAIGAARAEKTWPPSGQMSLLTVPMSGQAEGASGTPAYAPVKASAQLQAKLVPPPLAPQASGLTVSLEDAHKLLRVVPGAPWEVVELARRKAVQLASPLSRDVPVGQRQTMLDTARSVNAAYATLAFARSDRH